LEENMPISTSSVSVGNCYETANKQQRRVISIDQTTNQVIYESWGGNTGPKGNLTRTKVGLDKFANAVDKQITCPPTLKSLEIKNEEDKTDKDDSNGENND